MNAATIAAISTAAVSIIGAITALIRATKTKNAVADHIANHTQKGTTNGTVQS